MLDYIWTTNRDCSAYQDALQLRQAVFIQEQNIPAQLEIDCDEAKCTFVVGYTNNQAIATARLLPLDDTCFKIQRVAVLKAYRGQGLGKDLMQEIINYAKKNGRQHLQLNAQNQVQAFYRALGFKAVGQPFMEAGIKHIQMLLSLS